MFPYVGHFSNITGQKLRNIPKDHVAGGYNDELVARLYFA